MFKGFFNNGLFIFIIIATILIQTALVEYGGAAVRTVPLSLEQHLICLGIGFFTLINGLIVKKLLKPSWFAWIRIKENATPEELAKQPVAAVRSKSIKALSKKMNSHIDTKAIGVREPLLNTAINN